MKPRAKSLVSARKRPRQARSAQLVDDILEAAVRVLARGGAARFTTVRVAREAGVSVGSLYQYFPNKESVLYRLQLDEWKETGAVLAEILSDRDRPPPDRLRRAIRAFFLSERHEADLRAALGDAPAPEAPERTDHRAGVIRIMLTFLEEALPAVSPASRALAADVVMTSVAAIGERITSERIAGEPRSRAEIEAFAEAVGDMVCGYLDRGGPRA